MNPSTGTFTTMDTYQGSIFDPVSLHKYLYANANPVTYVDPSGYNSADLNEELTAIALDGGIEEIFKPAVSFALNYYWQFRAALPAVIAASSSIALLVVDSPEFADLVSRVANGELSVHSMSLKIQEYILQAQNFSEPVNNAVKNASGSGGSSGSLPPNDPDFWNKVKEAVDSVPNKFKELGKCDKFKDAFTKQLDKKGIDYEVIKIEPRPERGTSNIYSDRLGTLIGDNGYHFGVKIGNTIYDNFTTGGLDYDVWFNDLGGDLYIRVV